MKRFFFLFNLLAILIISCQKDDNETPPDPPQEFFKLKAIKTSYTYPGGITYVDSTSIIIDSINNKITLKEYDLSREDSSTETFTYNSNSQLALYEHTDTYDRLYISRMEFVRNAHGELTRVLSEYKNGLMDKSEGTCRYEKRGDTTFITFIDSTRKHPEGYRDARDYYQVAILDNRPVIHKSYHMYDDGKLDSTIEKYTFDGADNLTTVSSQQNNQAPAIYSYQRSGQAPTDLQKFIARWSGDIAWFSRAKLFHFLTYIGGGEYYLAGNALQSISRNNVPYITFINEFDGKGNLKKLTSTDPGSGNQISQEFEYRP